MRTGATEITVKKATCAIKQAAQKQKCLCLRHNPPRKSHTQNLISNFILPYKFYLSTVCDKFFHENVQQIYHALEKIAAKYMPFTVCSGTLTAGAAAAKAVSPPRRGFQLVDIC